MFGPRTVETVTDLVALLWEPSFQPVTLGLGQLCQATRGSLDKLLKVLESDCPNQLVFWATSLEGIPSLYYHGLSQFMWGSLPPRSFQIKPPALTFATTKEAWKFDSVIAGLIECSLSGTLCGLKATSDFMCIEAYESCDDKEPSVWDIKVALCMY